MNFRKHISETIKLALPVSLGQVGHIVTGISDSIMLGKYKALDLASSTLAQNLQFPLMLFGIGFSVCLSPLISEARGEKNPENIQKYLKHALLLFLGLSVILTVLILLVEFLLPHLKQDQLVAQNCVIYFRITAISVFFVILNQFFKQFSEGMGKPMFPMIISVVGNGLNIIGNYFLIYGHGFFPEMGLEGAAYATLGSRIFMFGAGIFFLFYIPEFKELLKKSLSIAIQKLAFLEMIGIGTPIAFQYIAEVAAFALSVVFIGWLGPDYIVAHNIAIGLAGFTYMIATGLGAATTVRVGYFVGEKRKADLIKAIRSSLVVVNVFMGFTAIIFLVGHNFFPTLYLKDTDQDIIKITSEVLILAGVFQLSDGLQMMCGSILRGMRDVKIPTIIGVCSYWVVGVPMGLLLAFYIDLKLQGFWWGFVIGLTVSAVFQYIRVVTKSKEVFRIKPKKVLS